MPDFGLSFRVFGHPKSEWLLDSCQWIRASFPEKRLEADWPLLKMGSCGLVDIVSKQVRSRMMSGIKGKNTKPEMVIRSALHRNGFRFRLHRIDLPGRPDIVLPKYRVVIFVHGCFWHQHQGCKYSKMPASNVEFWREKLDANRERDIGNARRLLDAGWRVLVIWECWTRLEKDLSLIAEEMGHWIKDRDIFTEMPASPGPGSVSVRLSA